MSTTTTGLATSFIQFSRASNATVTDSDGYISWAGHNLLTNSESFDASAWVKSSATVTANTDPAPNGTTTGDTIAASGANGTALQTWTAEAVPYTFGVWLRRKTGTGNIQIAADSGTYTTVTITSSWALYTVTQTPAAGSKSAGICIVTSGDEVYAWGAHLYRSDLGGMVANPARGDAYYPTTPRNLLGYTEAFDNAAWTKANATVSANAITSPNGLVTAEKLVENTATGLHFAAQSVSGDGLCTFAVFLKAGERTRVFVGMTDQTTGDAAIGADLSTGTTFSSTASVGSWTNISSSITSLGDGWYRVAVTARRGAGTLQTCYVRLVQSGTTTSYTGDGTSGIYVWGAQFSDSASLDAYSPVYGAAVTSAAYYAPRLDYDPVTLAARGLLVEEQRSNLVLHSAAFSQWTAQNGYSVTDNQATAPDGTQTAAAVSRTNAATQFLYQNVTASGTLTLSVWAKVPSGTATFVMECYDLTNGQTSPTFTATTTWQRFTFTATASNATTSWYVCIGEVNKTFYIWGAQLEAGSFATSYIPTGASTATRTADVASVSTQAFPYSATEGSLVASFTPINVAAACRAMQLDDGTTNERITLGINSTPNGLMTVNDGGVSQASIATGTPAANTTMKLAARYKVNDFAVSANGAAVSTDTSGTLPTVDTLRLGSGTSSTEPLNGWLRQVTYLPRALTNAELQSRAA